MLDERKQRILQAIINDYISSAEPVGSRTIARKYDLGVSPATIRNEMADLEMLGYLEQLHTSSGRIPSSKGYRFYVDDLLPPQPMTSHEKEVIDRWYRARVKRVEEVFQETAKIISRMTKNISLVLAPQITKAAFRCLQFLPLDSHRVIAASFPLHIVLKVEFFVAVTRRNRRFGEHQLSQKSGAFGSAVPVQRKNVVDHLPG